MISITLVSLLVPVVLTVSVLLLLAFALSIHAFSMREAIWLQLQACRERYIELPLKQNMQISKRPKVDRKSTHLKIARFWLCQISQVRKQELNLSKSLNRAMMKLKVIKNAKDEKSGQHPFSIMPLEMWGHLADQISDIQTWLAFSNANQLIYHSLERRRVAALLPEVLKIMYERLPRTEFGIGHVLCCRSVCKRWRNAVDTYLIDHELRLNFCRRSSWGVSTWPAFRLPSTWLYSVNTGKVEDAVGDFLRLRSANNGIRVIPFPSKDLGVFEVQDLARTAQDIRDFRAVITNLLRHFGTHLYYFNYSIDYFDSNGTDWYYVICGWLNLMPNLKRVNIRLDTEERLTDYHLQELDESVTLLPFPSLKRLVAIQFENVPSVVVSSALQMNPQIQKLRVIRQHHTYGQVLYFNFPAIKRLSELFLVAYAYDEIVQLEELLESPLQSLQIETAFSTGIYCAKRLFEILTNFNSTLQYLKLELRNSPSSHEQLFLENLKELHVIFHGKVNMDFILPLQSLTYLTVELLEHYSICEEVQFIEFVHCIENLESSNMWELFPKLRKVIVDTSGCKSRFNDETLFSYCRPTTNHTDFSTAPMNFNLKVWSELTAC